jgi:hypothetical protein
MITEKSIEWMKARKRDKPFFLMCHHKAPHRSWECHPKHKNLYTEDIKVPETFDDDYKNRVKAAAYAKIRVAEDLTYGDLGLVQPEGGSEVGELMAPELSRIRERKIPHNEDMSKIRLIDKDTGENYIFKTQDELRHFKYQRYMKRYQNHRVDR